MNAAMASELKRPKLLISVSTVPEAQMALEQGADIIDLKNPVTGALGALPLASTQAIVSLLKSQPAAKRKLTSATLGDLPMLPEQLLPQLKAVAATGVDVIKIGFFASQDYRPALQALQPYSQAGHSLMAVLFAETAYPEGLIAAIKQAGFIGVMLDTQHKNGLSLFDHYPVEQAGAFAEQVRTQGLLLGLAGSLRQAHIALAKKLQPNYIGFRGGVCQAHDRVSSLDAEKIKQIRQLL